MRLKIQKSYDPVCDLVRKMEKAKAAMVIVIDGEHGTGFALQHLDRAQLRDVPGMLRLLAKQIEYELATKKRVA